MSLGKVLVLEDDAIARATLSLAFDQEHIPFDMPETRTDILAALLTNKYSLVLFDTSLGVGTFENDPIPDGLGVLLVAYGDYESKGNISEFPICIPITKKYDDRVTQRRRLVDYGLPFVDIDINKFEIATIREFCKVYNTEGENYFNKS